ncbi:MAG: hypothetical protein Ct9H300mP21_02090 [Pseudomonadota bacterium]|nr:MAG: hypothetical protein Ct9H300mP21_02090 [Pseudomonadota bacterium]
MTSVQNNLLHVYAMTHYSFPNSAKGQDLSLISAQKFLLRDKARLRLCRRKGGNQALTREWAVALAPEKVRVNCVNFREC